MGNEHWGVRLENVSGMEVWQWLDTGPHKLWLLLAAVALITCVLLPDLIRNLRTSK